MALDSESLIRGIQSGRRLGPLGIDDDCIDRLVEHIRVSRLVLSQDTEETLALRNALHAPLYFVRPERKQLFDQYEIYVLPHPAFVAFAQKGEGGQSDAIVISLGAIDLIAANIYDVYVQELIPDSLQHVVLEEFRRDMDFTQLFANTLFLLRYRFHRYGEPLPRYSACLGEQALTHCATAIQGVVAFLLLHEIGHLELDHFECDTARAMQYQFIVEQSLSEYQKQEAEADQFALDSMIPRAETIATYWMTQALSFFASLELVAGVRDEGHPLALNRSSHSNALRMQRWCHPDIKPEPSDHTIRAERFLATERAVKDQPNCLIETSRESCMNVLNKCIHLLASEGVDLSSLLCEEQASWVFTEYAGVKGWE